MSINIESTSAFIDLLASSWIEEAKLYMYYSQLLFFLHRGQRGNILMFIKKNCLTWEKRTFSIFARESKYQIKLLFWSLPKISHEYFSLLTKNYGAVTLQISNKFSHDIPYIDRNNKKITHRSECCKKYVE